MPGWNRFTVHLPGDKRVLVQCLLKRDRPRERCRTPPGAGGSRIGPSSTTCVAASSGTRSRRSRRRAPVQLASLTAPTPWMPSAAGSNFLRRWPAHSSTTLRVIVAYRSRSVRERSTVSPVAPVTRIRHALPSNLGTAKWSRRKCVFVGISRQPSAQSGAASITGARDREILPGCPKKDLDRFFWTRRESGGARRSGYERPAFGMHCEGDS